MVILENIDIVIDKAILQNIDIDKISNRFKFGISNRATAVQCKYSPLLFKIYKNLSLLGDLRVIQIFQYNTFNFERHGGVACSGKSSTTTE